MLRRITSTLKSRDASSNERSSISAKDTRIDAAIGSAVSRWSRFDRHAGFNVKRVSLMPNIMHWITCRQNIKKLVRKSIYAANAFKKEDYVPRSRMARRLTRWKCNNISCCSTTTRIGRVRAIMLESEEIYVASFFIDPIQRDEKQLMQSW